MARSIYFNKKPKEIQFSTQDIASAVRPIAPSVSDAIVLASGAAELTPDTVTPALKRGTEGLVDSAVQSYEDVKQAWTDPNVGVGEAVATTAANVAAFPVEAVATIPMTVADATLPGTPMADLAQNLAQTEGGQKVQQVWSDLSEDDQRRIRTATKAMDFGIVSKLFKPVANAIAPNANTFVKDFYSGNLFFKMMGAGESFGEGTIRAFRESISPENLASRRKAGITLGLREEVMDMTTMANRANEVIRKHNINKARVAKGKTPLEITPEEANIYEGLKAMGGGNAKTAASYIEGAMIAKYYILKQSGEDMGVLKDLVEDNLISHSTTAADRSGIKSALFGTEDIPAGVQERLTKNAVDVHLAGGLKEEWVKGMKSPEDSYVAIRRPVGTSELGGERAGQMGTPHGRLFNLRRPFRDQQDMDTFMRSMNMEGAERADYLDLMEKKQTGNVLSEAERTRMENLRKVKNQTKKFRKQKQLDKLQESIAARRLKGQEPTASQQKRLEALLQEKRDVEANPNGALNPKQAEMLAGLEDRVNSGRLTDAQEARLTKLQQKVDRNPLRYSKPDEDGFIYFFDTHHSSAKELGGVRTVTAFNPETGQVINLITDRHDIFGRDPVGGKGLITVTAPVTYNAYEASHKGGLRDLGMDREGPGMGTDQAIAKTQARTGVSQAPVHSGTSTVEMMSGLAQDYMPTAETIDYLNAVRNASVLGGTAAYSGGRGLLSSYEEEQQ